MTAEGFVKASTNNLPYVDLFMVMDYIKRMNVLISQKLKVPKQQCKYLCVQNNNYLVVIQYTRECLYELINKNKPV